MQFLADENVEFGVVVWLRSLGHDVLDARTSSQGADDADLPATAAAEDRVFVTSDLDFGDLACRQKRPHAGIVLLRMADAAAADRLARLQRKWPVIEPRCRGHFNVVHDDPVRFRTVPP